MFPLIVALGAATCAPSNRCSNDGDCAAGFVCIDGICRQQSDGGVDGGEDAADGGGDEGPTVVMVPVPAGAFSMGCDDQVEPACEDDEIPLHEVTVSAFEIDQTEVTQKAFDACVRSGVCTAPPSEEECLWAPENNAELPVICINWEQARGYCQWAGKRLPTEAEWEWAARGSSASVYPWGDTAPDCQHAVTAECFDSPQPVGSLEAGASQVGAHDMAGNVWEWVSDWYAADYYGSSEDQNPQGPASGTHRAMRSGSYLHEASLARSANRGGEVPATYRNYLGFRCAR